MTRVLSAGFAESAHQVPVEEERPPEGTTGQPGGVGGVRTDGTRVSPTVRPRTEAVKATNRRR